MQQAIVGAAGVTIVTSVVDSVGRPRRTLTAAQVVLMALALVNASTWAGTSVAAPAATTLPGSSVLSALRCRVASVAAGCAQESSCAAGAAKQATLRARGWTATARAA